MIDKLDVKKRITRSNGITDLYFAVGAMGVPVKGAEAAEEAFDEFLFRLTAPDTESPAAQKKPIPDPQPGHTGCEGCKETGLTDACDKCSPPPAPVAKKPKEKFNPPEQKPAAKKTGKRVGGSILTCPHCQKEINSHGAHVHMKSHGPEKYAEWLNTPGRLGHGIGVKQPASEKKTAKKLPARPPSTPGAKPWSKKGNKYGIPQDLYKKDIRLYQRLWGRCKTLGIKYEDALKMEGQVTRRHKPDVKKILGKVEATPAEIPAKKPRVTHERLPFHQNKPDLSKQSAEAIPQSNEVKEPPLPAVEPKYGGFKIGDKVRQVSGSKIFTGTGSIVRAVPGSSECLVRFDSGQEWIRRDNLEAVPV
jgi:hypothetical protein